MSCRLHPKTICHCPTYRWTGYCWFTRWNVPNSFVNCFVKSGALWPRAVGSSSSCRAGAGYGRDWIIHRSVTVTLIRRVRSRGCFGIICFSRSKRYPGCLFRQADHGWRWHPPRQSKKSARGGFQPLAVCLSLKRKSRSMPGRQPEPPSKHRGVPTFGSSAAQAAPSADRSSTKTEFWVAGDADAAGRRDAGTTPGSAGKLLLRHEDWPPPLRN